MCIKCYDIETRYPDVEILYKDSYTALMYPLKEQSLYECDESNKCSICLSLCESTLSCGHVVHDSCIHKWLNNSTSCPVCRQTFDVRPAIDWELMSIIKLPEKFVQDYKNHLNMNIYRTLYAPNVFSLPLVKRNTYNEICKCLLSIPNNDPFADLIQSNLETDYTTFRKMAAKVLTIDLVEKYENKCIWHNVDYKVIYDADKVNYYKDKMLWWGCTTLSPQVCKDLINQYNIPCHYMKVHL